MAILCIAIRWHCPTDGPNSKFSDPFPLILLIELLAFCFGISKT